MCQTKGETMIDNVLQNLTDTIILRHSEKLNLRKIAKKIKKVPDTIHIPSEYLVGEL